MPIQIGSSFSSIDMGIIRDDTKLNISNLNNEFCELTATYWIWKNTKSEIVGLFHYRRYLSNINSNIFGDIKYTIKCFFLKLFRLKISEKSNIISYVFENINSILLDENEIKKSIHNNDIIVPAKYFLGRNTAHNHFDQILSNRFVDKLIEIVRECENPEFINIFEKSLNNYFIYPGNIFVSRRAIFDEYCSLIFPILLKHMTYYNSKGISYFRIAGYMGELLTNAFLLYKKHNSFYLKEKKIIQIN